MPVGVKFQFAISKKGELKTSKSDFCPHFGGKFPTVPGRKKFCFARIALLAKKQKLKKVNHSEMQLCEIVIFCQNLCEKMCLNF